MDAKLFATIRKINGLTQQEFADLLDVSQSIVGKVELEERTLSHDLLSRVKRVYSLEHIDAVQSFLSREDQS